MSSSTAFGISEIDIETVLRWYSPCVVNEEGRSFSQMAESIHDRWCDGPELDRIASAALDGGICVHIQTNAAHAEIRDILAEEGILKS